MQSEAATRIVASQGQAGILNEDGVAGLRTHRGEGGGRENSGRKSDVDDNLLEDAEVADVESSRCNPSAC
jgi:hypothetical protein